MELRPSNIGIDYRDWVVPRTTVSHRNNNMISISKWWKQYITNLAISIWLSTLSAILMIFLIWVIFAG